MEFKKVSEPIMTDDMYYDLFEGGYICAARLLVDEQDTQRVQEAVDTIVQFLEEAQEQGALAVI
jgi:hypothetical protein